MTHSVNLTKAEQQFFSVKETAVRYGVKPTTVWRWVREGKLPEPVKVCETATRWKLSDLEAYEATL